MVRGWWLVAEQSSHQAECLTLALAIKRWCELLLCLVLHERLESSPLQPSYGLISFICVWCHWMMLCISLHGRAELARTMASGQLWQPESWLLKATWLLLTSNTVGRQFAEFPWVLVGADQKIGCKHEWEVVFCPEKSLGKALFILWSCMVTVFREWDLQCYGVRMLQKCILSVKLNVWVLKGSQSSRSEQL